MRWFLLILGVLLGVLGAVFLPVWVAIPEIILLGVAIFLALVWFFLAPSNYFFTFVKEGTCKIITRGDSFEKCLIQWDGHTFDHQKTGVDRWEVIEGEEPWHPFGGLRFYGLWPLLDVAIYALRWFDLQRIEGEIEKPQFHEQEVDYVLLRPDVYWTIERGAETKPPERIPLNVEFLVTIRVINPYKAIFIAPINWTENVMSRLDALFRSYIAGKTLDELIEAKGDPGGIWGELKEKDLIQQTFKREWGVEIEEGGIQIKDIGLPEDYQKAAAAQKTEKMKAEGVKKRIEIEWGAIKEFGDLGKLIRSLEAVEKSPLAASLTIQAIPGLAELFRGVFGRPSEGITREELSEIRKALQELSQRGEQSS